MNFRHLPAWHGSRLIWIVETGTSCVFVFPLCATNRKATMNDQDDFSTSVERDPSNRGAQADAERVSRTKRTLLKAGWIVPVIGAISLPASGRVNCSCDPFAD